MTPTSYDCMQYGNRRWWNSTAVHARVNSGYQALFSPHLLEPRNEVSSIYGWSPGRWQSLNTAVLTSPIPTVKGTRSRPHVRSLDFDFHSRYYNPDSNMWTRHTSSRLPDNTLYRSWDMPGTIAAVLSLLQDFVAGCSGC